MTIPVSDLISCVNTSICNVTTCELTILQLSSVSKDFDRSWVRSVQDVASLPAASLNKGRMIYVTSVCAYRISDGVSWSNDFTSTIQDFAVWSWGSNSAGQLGICTTTNTSSPVSVVGGFSDWCQISAGLGSLSAAVRTNGTAWGWGCNQVGVLGDNSTTNSSSPVSVVGSFTDWCQISAATCHTAAVRTNRTIWTWGLGSLGQLGDNTTTNKSSPVSVVGGFTDWCQVDTGFAHTVALRTGGSAWSWGEGTFGKLGDNTTTNRSSPVSVVGGFTDWCQVSAGSFSSAGVRRNGTAWGWGRNTCGALGDYTTTDSSSPVSVVGGFTDWCQISVVSGTSVAVRSNGTIWAWGQGLCGRLGDNTTVDKSSPVSVVGGFTDWCQSSTGGSTSAGMRTNGSTWSWGIGSLGRLGDNTTVDKSSPVSVVGGFTDWYQVSVGSSHTIALNATRGFV